MEAYGERNVLHFFSLLATVRETHLNTTPKDRLESLGNSEMQVLRLVNHSQQSMDGRQATTKRVAELRFVSSLQPSSGVCSAPPFPMPVFGCGLECGKGEDRAEQYCHGGLGGYAKCQTLVVRDCACALAKCERDDLPTHAYLLGTLEGEER